MKKLTGYFDNRGTPIREGDIIESGMRRGDPKGWTTERVRLVTSFSAHVPCLEYARPSKERRSRELDTRNRGRVLDKDSRVEMDSIWSGKVDIYLGTLSHEVGLMPEVELTQGQKTFVDDNLLPVILQRKWFARKKWIRKGRWTGQYYAATKVDKKNVDMQHIVIGFPLNGMVVDHINGNPLDNRLENLRIVTHRENCSNQKIHRDGGKTSKYLGVSWDKTRKTWIVCARISGRGRFFGRFKDENEAGEMANKIYADLFRNNR